MSGKELAVGVGIVILALIVWDAFVAGILGFGQA
jgi:hypothetical protein